MKKYYRLVDDVNFPKRWYLGQIQEVDNWIFTSAKPLNIQPLSIFLLDIYQYGEPMDFTLTEGFVVPIISTKIYNKLKSYSGLEFFPVKIDIFESAHYYIMVATNKLDCLDEELSIFKKFKDNDPIRPDLAGHYYGIQKLIIDKRKTKNSDIFRIEKGENYLIVSEIIKQAFDEVSASGAYFIEV